MNFIDLTAQRFGRLVVERRIDNDKHGGTRWMCMCDCGKISVCLPSNLRGGRSKSCGCLNKEVAVKTRTTHNMSGTKEYVTWRNMKTRCENPNSTAYKYYGGRGITICKEWLDSFEAFYRDMGDKPEGLSIDRIDNDGGYSPDNCRWATQSEQCFNQRRSL
jgi:hypothetical protein